jgi:hypothetical protein
LSENAKLVRLLGRRQQCCDTVSFRFCTNFIENGVKDI